MRPTGTSWGWNSPIPYLFGGLFLVLGLISWALIMLIWSYRKQSNSNNNPIPTFADHQRPTRIAEADLGPKVLVVMAGDNKPTFIATPASPSTTQNN
ncbi:hypothetical protein RHMOL_Rhmol08G0089600 [Rhododendron molle]|uniref:Uncharacterized protein n=1 Tax=Rhododendron molle TaxID=49168 RepID=A0ACC0MMJ0_RHOML|nr:hypothetical protein RHMOL_Rhmol08G0089600 [Rhododendron molle]